VPDAAVFLDRDGTLIEEVGYASRPEQIRILGGVARGLAQLADAGYKLIVVTNQSGIARGYATEDDLKRFHEELDRQLDLLGAAVDAYYVCPHLPDPTLAARPDLAVDCDCRKPKPGLLLRAAEDFGIDLGASWMVGDTWRDIAAGQAAGCRTIKLPADAAHEGPRPEDVAPPTATADDLAGAARIILAAQEPSAEARAGSAATAGAAEDLPARTAAAPAVAAEQMPAKPEMAPAETSADESDGAEPAEEPIPDEQDTGLEEPEEVERFPAGGPAGVSGREAIAESPTAGAPAAGPTLAPVSPKPDAGRPRIPPGPYCARCGRDIDPAKVADGSAAERHGLLLCPECLAGQPGDAAGIAEAGTDELLRSILRELERLRRAQRPSSLSSLRLLAYIIQVAALFFGFGLGLLSEDRALYIQVAVLLQLLVLALLLFERRS